MNDILTVELQTWHWEGNIANDHDLKWLDEFMEALGLMQGNSVCESYW